MNNSNGKRRLLTPHEVAQRLDVSKGTVDRWVREGRIPCVPHLLGRGKGRRIYLDWAEVAKAVGIKP